MAISHETEWFYGLQQAVQKAKQQKQKVLFSVVREIDDLDPLSFYHAGRERYAGERFYWQDPEKELTIAGLGIVEKIQVKADAKRVRKIEANWTELQKNAVKVGVSGVVGTGPLVFGGYSFDYNKTNSLLWDQFGDSLFYIPAFMLSIVKGQAYLTTNIVCTSEDEANLFIDLINERENDIRNRLTNVAVSVNEYVEQIEDNPEGWKKIVAEAVSHMKHSELDKVVLARELRIVFKERIETVAVLRRLQKEQAGSFIFCLESAGDCFIGATPERLVKKHGNELFSACLAGSIARGKDAKKDRQLEHELLHDQKNLLEHQYVVSMIKDALSLVCKRLDVPKDPTVMKNRHIQHLYTPVSGECDANVSIFDVIGKLHPTPAMGGLPTEQAVAWIRENEELERGFYASPIGWSDSYGNGEFAVGIRSALIQGNEASLFAGCGVLEDSTPESEYEETGIKFNPMLSALGGNLHE
ncbi:isochorismate synthase [Peribacillus loiseleuriae]|uniref:isochorismate synthase n=1 Tax=Peribacillus loiseleuriae TaxID=1679170 RepID=UPI003CFD1A3B